MENWLSLQADAEKVKLDSVAVDIISRYKFKYSCTKYTRYM